MGLFNNKRKKEKEEQERRERVLKLEQEKEKREQEELERVERIIQDHKEKLEEEKKKIEIKKEQERLKQQEEQERLQREEQERLKEEQQKRLKEKQEMLAKKNRLINEVVDNYISISNGITNIIKDIYGEYRIKEFIPENLDKDEMHEMFGQIVFDIYSVASNVNSYEELVKKVFEYSFIQKISKKYLNDVDYQKIMIQYKNSVYTLKKDYDLVKNNDEWGILEEFMSGLSGGFNDIFNELKLNYENIDLIILGLIVGEHDNNFGWFTPEEKNKLNISEAELDGIHTYFEMDSWSWEDEVKNISYFIRQLFYAHIFVYYIIFLRKVKKFEENDELMHILSNIEKENEEMCQVLLKFYPIYINFYECSFEYKLTIYEIETLILASKNKESFDSLIKFNYYKNEIDDFKSHKDFKKLIDSIDKNIFMKYHSINDLNIVDNQEYFYNELFDYIIVKIIKNLNHDEILNIIFNKSVYIDRLKKNDELREILKNKNKYLHDIKEEKKINKLDIHNVISGDDFEKFLKELFLRLGYHVALTQQTRDQGADLIIEKELVKIVVQAKFYGSTVGNKAVQEVIAAKSYYDADSCMVVTNNTFTSSAYELAKANKVRLVDGDELNSMIEIANLFLE